MKGGTKNNEIQIVNDGDIDKITNASEFIKIIN
jgi:hypothetical protein